MPLTLSSPRVMVCEGTADKEFFVRLISERSLPSFDVLEVNGKNNLGSYLTGLRAASGFENLSSIVVAFDHDENPGHSFAFIQRQIQDAGSFPLPESPLVPAKRADFPAVVVMMIPWVGEPGTLESLCLPCLYEAFPKIKDCLDEL